MNNSVSEFVEEEVKRVMEEQQAIFNAQNPHNQQAQPTAMTDE